jgi:hypothetical protein
MSGRDQVTQQYKIAVVWRGDAEARRVATPQNNRVYRIFEELTGIGIRAEPAVYDETFAGDVRNCGGRRAGLGRPDPSREDA